MKKSISISLILMTLFCLSSCPPSGDQIERLKPEDGIERIQVNHIDHSYSDNSTFEFDTLPVAQRVEAQIFSIKHFFFHQNMTIESVILEGQNKEDFTLEATGLAGYKLPPNTPLEFTLKFTPTSYDSAIKRCIVKITADLREQPFYLNISATAGNKVEIFYGEPGTYIWTCSSNITATVELIGGGQGGYAGASTSVCTDSDGYSGNNSGNGGRGGSAGSYVSVENLSLTAGITYLLIIGNGGTPGGGYGNVSSISGGFISLITAQGGLALAGQAPGDPGGTASGGYNGAGGAGGNCTEDSYAFPTASGGGRTPRAGVGANGSSAPPASGNGGGGGAGGCSGGYFGNCSGGSSHNGGSGGAGGSGYVRIQWYGYQ